MLSKFIIIMSAIFIFATAVSDLSPKKRCCVLENISGENGTNLESQFQMICISDGTCRDTHTTDAGRNYSAKFLANLPKCITNDNCTSCVCCSFGEGRVCYSNISAKKGSSENNSVPNDLNNIAIALETINISSPKNPPLIVTEIYPGNVSEVPNTRVNTGKDTVLEDSITDTVKTTKTTKILVTTTKVIRTSTNPTTKITQPNRNITQEETVTTTIFPPVPSSTSKEGLEKKPFNYNYLYILFVIPVIVTVGVGYYILRRRRPWHPNTWQEPKKVDRRVVVTPSWVFSEPEGQSDDSDNEDATTTLQRQPNILFSSPSTL